MYLFITFSSTVHSTNHWLAKQSNTYIAWSGHAICPNYFLCSKGMDIRRFDPKRCDLFSQRAKNCCAVRHAERCEDKQGVQWRVVTGGTVQTPGSHTQTHTHITQWWRLLKSWHILTGVNCSQSNPVWLTRQPGEFHGMRHSKINPAH